MDKSTKPYAPSVWDIPGIVHQDGHPRDWRWYLVESDTFQVKVGVRTTQSPLAIYYDPPGIINNGKSDKPWTRIPFHQLLAQCHKRGWDVNPTTCPDWLNI